MISKKKKIDGEFILSIANVQLKDQQAKLAIILINDYGYTKTTLVNEGVVALAIKEGVAIKDDTAN